MRWIIGAALAAAFAIVATPSVAEDKIPALSTSKPVSIILGSGPGSGPDNMARTYVQIAAKYTDQPFVIENRPGSSGLVAVNHLLRQRPDGMSLLVFTRSFAINHLTLPDVESPLDKLHYVGVAMFAPLVAFTYADGSPYQDGAAMLAECEAKPGQKWAAAFVASLDWLMVQIIWKETGCKGEYIPFDDGAALAAAVMGKHVAIGVGDMGDIVSRAGRLKPLLIATDERDPRLPDVPTLKELGWNIVQENHRGLVSLKDIPEEAKEFHGKVFQKVIADPDWAKFIDSQKARIGGMDGADMEKLEHESEELGKFIFAESGLLK
ncbi:tripartite tricarboxylate transporter substrate binding protein [Pseudochelatococcus sp. B33]